jgi:hypothetical protein
LDDANDGTGLRRPGFLAPEDYSVSDHSRTAGGQQEAAECGKASGEYSVQHGGNTVAARPFLQ